jgi:hypothetical protein
MNKGRLANVNINIDREDIRMKVINLLNTPFPYLIKVGKRFRRIDNKLSNIQIIALNTIENKKFTYPSISKAGRDLGISRKKKLNLY